MIGLIEVIALVDISLSLSLTSPYHTHTDIHSHGDHALGVGRDHWNPHRNSCISNQHLCQESLHDQIQTL